MRSGAARAQIPKTSTMTRPETPVISEFREVMDIRQAADYLGVSSDSLYRYASEGIIPAFRLGNRWRFKKSRLDDWMDEQSTRRAPASAPKSREKKPVRSVL